MYSVSVTAAWYEMTTFTFSDLIAVNRNEIILSHSPKFILMIAVKRHACRLGSAM